MQVYKKWFDMIAAGIKKEEYREITDYWNHRLFNEDWTHVRFMNGYNENAPTVLVELKSIRYGVPRPEWSDGSKQRCYVIELGKIIS